jgi:hypothetical protein
MELSPFRIERFYARYEHSTRFMLSSSDCESRTIAELLELEPDAHERLLECWCGYTEPPGAPALRQAIASLYERTGAGEVLVTSCAEEGIFLIYHALLRPGDHAIVETPCYESALQLARSRGMSGSALAGPTCPMRSASSTRTSPAANDVPATALAPASPGVPHPRRVMPPAGSGGGLPVYPSEASGRARSAITGRLREWRNTRP